MAQSYHPLRIFSGSAHRELAAEIAQTLRVALGVASVRRLPDSEIHVLIDEVVRDQDIFFIQPCSEPVNDHLMETMLFLDAFRRASAPRGSSRTTFSPSAGKARTEEGR